ncbi:MAG: type IV pilin protein [Methylococcales bacterium]|nr:type IV pilin protein [Methylococcaceae bacterium]
MRQSQQGFTLIELMITVAIVGILAAVALPSYQDSVLKSHRADAKAALLGLSNAMERQFTVNNSYCDAGGTGGAQTCGSTGVNDTGTPSVFTIPPETTSFYDVTISSVTASSYTLSATPVSGGSQANDKCGTLTLTHLGVKNVTSAATGITAADCW